MSARSAVRLARLDSPEAREAYADLLSESPQRTAFATLAFADAACDAFGLTGRLALLEDAGRAMIGAVLFEKKTGPFRQAIVPPLTPYTGPVLREPVGLASAEALGSFLDALKPHFASIAFQPPPDVADVRPFTWAGFASTPRYTYWGPSGLDAAPIYVRKMLRENGTTRVDGSRRETGTDTIDAPDAASDVIAAMQRAFGRIDQDVPVDAARAERLVRRLAADGLAQITVAETRGARVGAVATLADDRTGHFWTGAGDPGPSMLMMMAHASQRLAETGRTEFDLMGANIARISTFKARFGLPLTVSYRAVWTGSRVLRLREAFRS